MKTYCGRCGREFLRLSTGATGCPVHGIQKPIKVDDSLRADLIRVLREEAAAQTAIGESTNDATGGWVASALLRLAMRLENGVT